MREERGPKVLLSAANVQMRALAKGLKGAVGPESQPAWLLEGAAQGWCCRIPFHAGVKQDSRIYAGFFLAFDTSRWLPCANIVDTTTSCRCPLP